MVITRSQARSGQPLDLAASPRVNIPGRAHTQTPGIPQQPSFDEGGVRRGGGPATSSAVRVRSPLRCIAMLRDASEWCVTADLIAGRVHHSFIIHL